MNPNYNQTITIYNCLRAADNPDEKKDVWYRTVIENCFYKNKMERSEYASRDPKMASTYIARIPQSKWYKPYREWAALPHEQREKYFTGSIKDIVVKGTCTDEIFSISPNTAAELLSRNKPDAFLITAFSDNTSHRRAKHYKAGG